MKRTRKSHILRQKANKKRRKKNLIIGAFKRFWIQIRTNTVSFTFTRTRAFINVIVQNDIERDREGGEECVTLLNDANQLMKATNKYKYVCVLCPKLSPKWISKCKLEKLNYVFHLEKHYWNCGTQAERREKDGANKKNYKKMRWRDEMKTRMRTSRKMRKIEDSN